MQSIEVVSGLAVMDGKLLMGKRPKGKMRPELWELPGGKVNPSESFANALVREWKEETRLNVEVGTYLGVSTLHIDITLALHLYELRPRSGRWPEQLRPWEHDELRWVDPLEALHFLPCSPGYYLHWPLIARWINQPHPTQTGLRSV